MLASGIEDLFPKGAAPEAEMAKTCARYTPAHCTDASIKKTLVALTQGGAVGQAASAQVMCCLFFVYKAGDHAAARRIMNPFLDLVLATHSDMTREEATSAFVRTVMVVFPALGAFVSDAMAKRPWYKNWKIWAGVGVGVVVVGGVTYAVVRSRSGAQ